MSDQTSQRTEILRLQYDRCRADMVTYDSMLWQIPGIAYVINAAVVSFVITGKATGWGASVAAGLLFVLTAPLTLALIKNRLFQVARAEYAEDLLRKLCGHHRPLPDIPTQTTEAWTLASRRHDLTTGSLTERIGRVAQSTLGRRRAYNALLITLLTTHLLQLAIVVMAPIVS